MTIMRRMRTAGSRSAGSRRSGFTLIEVLMALSIVGILASLAIPNLRSMTFRARATEVAGDLEVVRISTVQFNGDAHTWPVDSPLGVIPPELNGYLPDGFSFQGNGFELKYENFNIPGGLPGDPTTTQLIAVSVTVEIEELSNAVVELLGGSIVFSVGLTHTVVIDRS